MTHILEADKTLLTPEHWGGLDINDPDLFKEEPETFELTPLEQHKAAIALSDFLSDTMHDGSTDMNGGGQSVFDPDEEEMPDGTALILDTESLSAYNIQPGHGELQAKPLSAGPGIGSGGFLDLWRRQQPGHGDPEHGFGREEATFIEEQMVYTRALEWGVLLTRDTGTGRRRAVCTWGFSAPRTSSAGVIVPVDIKDAWPKNGEELPIEVGQTHTRPSIRSFHFAIRRIARINEIRVLTPEA